jgi:AraC-like DNA-binding protein
MAAYVDKDVATSATEGRHAAHAVSRSAAVYDSSLGLSGGRRVDASSHFQKNDLHVGLYESPPYDLTIAAVDVPRLSINLVDAPVSGAMASDRSQEYAARRHSLFFTPSRCDAHWAKSKSSRHLNIYLSSEWLNQLATETGSIRFDRPLLDMHVRRLRPLIDALEVTVRLGEPYAHDASVGLAHLVISALARAPNQGVQRLKVRTLERVREYVAARLPEGILVADVAAAVGMPIGRFTASFRASTGLTPYRYIMQERIEAARRLLRERDCRLADVAVLCGFSSQQHMATTIRKVTGVTPSHLRRDWRPSI